MAMFVEDTLTPLKKINLKTIFQSKPPINQNKSTPDLLNHPIYKFDGEADFQVAIKNADQPSIASLDTDIYNQYPRIG